MAGTWAPDRPGMPVVRRLPNGTWFMSYEICDPGGQYQCVVHYRTSADDQLALGALRALHEHGVRVPEEVAVALLQHRMDEATGSAAADASAADVRSPQDLVVAHRLVLRESTEGADGPLPTGPGTV